MSLVQDLDDCIKENSLLIPNVCLVYDQLLKLKIHFEKSPKSPISESLIDDVKILIAFRFSEACASDSFNQISEDTLVSILNFNMLNISELDLFKACIKWTDNEMLRQELEPNQANKRNIFEPIKRLIRFSDLSVVDFSSVFGLDYYLNLEEISKIFLSLSHKSYPIPIDCRSPRVSAKVCVVRGIKSEDVAIANSSRHDLRISVKFSKKICISSIKTFAFSIISSYKGLELKILEDGKELEPGWRILLENIHNAWVIDFSQCIRIFEPNIDYKMIFSFLLSPNSHNYNYNSSRNSIGASRDLTLKSEKGEAMFKIESDLGYHCIEKMDYWSI